LGHIQWSLDTPSQKFPQPAGDQLARLTYRAIYGHDSCPELVKNFVVQDEHLAWMVEKCPEK
jgi:hypothetical protein